MKRSTFFLLIVLIALGYVAFRFFSRAPNPIFETQLIAIDTASVTMISIFPGEAPEEEVLVKREGKTWIASRKNQSVRAPFGTVKALLASLVRIESHHIEGKGPEVWTACGLEPGQGTRIQVFRGAQVKEDFVVGNFHAEEEGKGFTFLRLWDGESVYAVPGELGSALWPGFEAFRSKDFLHLDPEKVQEIRWELQGVDSAMVFERGDTVWQRRLQVDSFLMQIQHLKGMAFVDAFDPLTNARLLEGRITFFGTDWDAPVEVSYYRDSTEVQPFIFYSTGNPDNYFASDSSHLFLKLVQPFYSFFSAPQNDSANQ